MARRIIITADDCGLTRSATDAILATADAGALTQVSLLANGQALAYAAGECAARPQLALSAHLNLTEGPALSAPGVLRLLADERGMFRYSVAGLLARYLFAPPRIRAALGRETSAELALQWGAIRDALAARGGSVSRADGHQHVHMLPFVFDALLDLPGVEAVRIPTEPFYAASLSELPNLYHVAGACLIRLLARHNRARAHARGIATEDAFIGLLYSGHMSEAAVEEGLKAALKADSLEIAFHPGVAVAGELGTWKGSRADISWHYDAWRAREGALLRSSRLRTLIDAWRAGTLGISNLTRLLRFGISGASAAIVNLGIVYILTSALGVWYPYSLVPAFFAAVGVSFTLQKFWTFADPSRARWTRQAATFLLTQAANLVIDEFGVALLVRAGVWYLFAQVGMLVLISLSSFFIFDRIIFARRQASPSA